MLEIAGYEIKRKVFVSKRSVVYGGIRLKDQFPVIIKVCATPFPSDSENRRFRREYELGAQFDDEHIIRYLSLEPLPRGLAIVQEDIGAEGLRDLIPERGLPIKTFLTLAEQMTSGVAAIHRQNIIHKDIKPSNILVADDHVKIIDFGISSQLTLENPEAAGPGNLEGTLAYMSPEQTGRMNRDVDYRSDFYALGVTFFEMLTGRLPFETSDSLELIHNHIAKKPPPPQRLREEIPKPVANIVLKLLEKNAEARYQSAFGLLEDLKWCLKEYRLNQNVRPFPLGLQDTSEKFRIPQNLYGRDRELAILSDAIERVDHGAVEVVLVSGAAGVGKSRLVNEIRRKIITRRGYMVSGKFDQFNQDTAYSAIIQAFGELARQILGEEEQAVQSWKVALLEALDQNSQILVDLIPEFAHLLGRRPKAPEVGPKENRYRFNTVLRKFVSVFADKDHPLVLFLDDLQWADAASLKLMEQLITHSGIHNFLLISAYRDDVLEPDTHVMKTLSGFRDKNIRARHLHLDALKADHVLEIIEETLDCDRESARPLGELCMRRTQGNPLFLHELLQDLHRGGLFAFSHEEGRWIWNMSDVREADVNANIVDFVVHHLTRLPAHTRAVLQIAACIGVRFQLRTLAIIQQCPQRQTAEAIWPAILEGVIQPLDDGYRYAHMEGVDNEDDVLYRFPHDRIQEAAYALINPAERAQRHLQIGRLLLKRYNQQAQNQEAHLFEITHQLNEGRSLITSPEERAVLLDLNFRAAQRANEATASKPALAHLSICLSLLPGNAWTHQYDLAFKIIREYAQTAYLCADFQLAAEKTRELYTHARTVQERAQILLMKANQYTMIGEYEHACQACIEGLGLLGMKINRRYLNFNILRNLALVRLKLISKTINSIGELPQVTDQNARLRMQLLVSLSVPAYVLNDLKLFADSILRNMYLVLRHGNAPEASHAHQSYGFFISAVFGQFHSGDQFAQLGFRVNQYFGDLYNRSRSHFLRAFTGVWTRHWREFTQDLRQALEIGSQSGDVMFTSFAAVYLAFWDPDINLETALKISNQSLEQIAAAKFRDAYASALIHHQALLNLAGRTRERFEFDTDLFDEEEYVSSLESVESKVTQAHYLYFKTRTFWFYEDNVQAFAWLKQLEPLVPALRSQICLVECCLLSFLIRAALYHDLKDGDKRRAYHNMRKQLTTMRKWAKVCPLNFDHLQQLMEAEWAALQDHGQDAVKRYDEAIQTAQRHEYPRYQALANELAGRFFRRQGALKIAAVYMRDAYELYVRWGARAKVYDLEERYGQDLLKGKIMAHLYEQADVVEEPVVEEPESLPPAQKDQEPSKSFHVLDLATVTKASRAISREIDLERLLDRMMRIIIESVGAQRGFLILDTPSGLVIQASRDVDSEMVSVLQEVPLDENRELSRSIIRYVLRTGENVVLHNAAREGPFTKSLYIMKHKPRSVLCMPIRHKDRITGVVYLENNLVTKAFTEARVQVLYILLSQAAISLDNARLFKDARQSAEEIRLLNEELERRVAERTTELEKTQKELVERAHHAGMADIATAVLHNVGNILNSVITSAQLILSTAEKTKLNGLIQAIDLLKQNTDDIQHFIDEDPRGAKLIEYLIRIEGQLSQESTQVVDNVDRLIEKVEAIKNVIMSQQNYASGGFKQEDIALQPLIEDALSIQESALAQADIKVVTRYERTPPIRVQRVKLIHIVLNLIKNALEAMEQSTTKKLDIHAYKERNKVCITFIDTGMGISMEHLSQIFDYGFTTKEQAQGFGLHSSLAAMKEMNGDITAHSPGKEQGASFTLTFPVAKKRERRSDRQPIELETVDDGPNH